MDVKLALEDRPGSGYGVHRPGLSEEEASLVAGLLDRVRLFSATEGLIVKVKLWKVGNGDGVHTHTYNNQLLTQYPVPL